MCEACDQSDEDQAPAGTGRRRFLAAGLGMTAAAPLLFGSGSAIAQAQSPPAGGAVAAGPYPTRAWGVTQTAGKFAPMTIQRRALGADDVLLDILYAGICHSDVHTARGDWGVPGLPCVPGHEIVGRVAAVGRNVTKFRVGDYGGVGCMVDACGTCENCLADREQICVNGTTFTYDAPDKVSGGHTLGGYSERIVVTEKFVIRIPPGMDLRATAPILCAGITTFSPIRHWNVVPGQRVAVVGLGVVLSRGDDDGSPTAADAPKAANAPAEAGPRHAVDQVARHREQRLHAQRDRDEPSAEARVRTTFHFRRLVAERLPGFSADPVATETCLYTMTPDGDFVLERVGSVVICSCCSGHGFKFAPRIGELIAELATGTSRQAPSERFAIGRFALDPR